MALQKQIHLYSVDTSFFYTDEEYKIHESQWSKENKCSKKQIKEQLYAEFKKPHGIRKIREDMLKIKHVVSMFESTLSRTLGLKVNELTTDLFIVKTYYFDILEDIILNGFIYQNEKYVCFTASAGQIRTKKTIFIKESILQQYEKTLMCGLTKDCINSKGGININKLLAYFALCNSATDQWLDFDIKKSIVVDDMETVVTDVVDFIDDKTYEITRKEMGIPIVHTDGCGIILPRKSEKNFMVRLPWIKGLLVSFPYDKFVRQYGGSKIKDIYGKEWDVIEDDIEVIFTKSQFKMYKYYSSWDDYCIKYIENNCQAGKANEEGSLSNEARIGYQMLQSLTDITDSEIELLTEKTRSNIKDVCRNVDTMYKLLGVKESNVNKNYLQQALEINPTLINDIHVINTIKQVRRSMVKDGKAGKIDIFGRYTFISPDLYAFCEWLFLGKKNPKGLLNRNEVYCNLFKDVSKLDCLRSPHLYREHAIRNNVVDDNKSEWFTTSALYTSCDDLISKILQFDVDGDCSLIVADSLLVSIAERNMKDIVPLYYNMAKAEARIISNRHIYEGLIAAYTGGNIGVISNDISKIWNSKNINLDIIKLLCMENNFTIDYAKTLYKPKRPIHIKKLISSYTKVKVPHFFIQAKDKKRNQVEKNNDSTVNRIAKMIKSPKIDIGVEGKFDYTLLMQDKNIEIDEDIVELYNNIETNMRDYLDGNDNNMYTYQFIRLRFIVQFGDLDYITDVLVKYLHEKNKKTKNILWNSFGDILVDNLRNNTKIKYIYCNKCGCLIEQTSNRKIYCDKCAKEIHKEVKRRTWHNNKIKYTRQLENASKHL